MANDKPYPYDKCIFCGHKFKKGSTITNHLFQKHKDRMVRWYDKDQTSYILNQKRRELDT